MKTINEVNQAIAKKYNLPLTTVEQVNKQYWDHVRESLANPDHYVYNIPFVGFFYTEPKLLFKSLAYHLRLLRVVKSGKKIRNRLQTEGEGITGFRKLWKLKQKLGWKLSKGAKKLSKIT